MSGLMISAAGRSSGKTSVATGLIAALVRRGIAVQPFKRGPDFIDPQWLGAACGRGCRNLDLRLQGEEGVDAYWARHAAGADLALVEGSLGLHDGLRLDGADSNAALARRLGLPVVLVLDARGMGRGAAAIVAGLAAFDPQVRVAGVVLNRVAGKRHADKLRAAIEAFTAVKVLGAIPEDDRFGLVERHLGLTPANEVTDARCAVARLADAVAEFVDLEAVIDAASLARPLPRLVAPPPRPVSFAPPLVRIGIARDRAFGFYYPDDLEALRDAGAELVAFDTLSDARLPSVDGLFIGGGFPEVFAADLEANASMRRDIRRAIEGGLAVHAECGGLMYLSRSIRHRGIRREMVGAIPADVVVHRKPVGKGYVTLAQAADHPWGRSVAAEIQAHEFHYSSVENADPTLRFAYRVIRGHGVDGERDGIVYRNVLASYAHLRSVGDNDWAARFVAFARRIARGVPSRVAA